MADGLDCQGHPGPVRAQRDRHGREQRARARHRSGAGTGRRLCGDGLPQPGQGTRRGRADPRRRAGRSGAARGARPREPGVGARLRGALQGHPRRPRPADQQRGRDGAAATPDRGWLRAPVRHQPPRPLPAHHAAAGLDGGARGCPGGHALEHGAQDRPDLVPQPGRRPALLPLARLRTVEAGEPALRAGARPAPAQRGLDREEPRRPPRLRGHQPPERLAADDRPRRDEGLEQVRRSER